VEIEGGQERERKEEKKNEKPTWWKDQCTCTPKQRSHRKKHSPHAWNFTTKKTKTNERAVKSYRT